MARARGRTPSTITVYGFVGNLGCIRFAPQLRKVSGVKRGDRLLVLEREGGGIVLEKVDLPAGELRGGDVEVAPCACEQPPEACGRGPREIVGVGWSYVQLNHELATELGLLADQPVRLVAEAGQIAVEPVERIEDGAAAPRLACPP
jgi:hypothetical protein